MRIFLLIFLVFVLPAAVYWVATGTAHPADAAERFLHQFWALRGPPRAEPEEEPEFPEEPAEAEDEEPETPDPGVEPPRKEYDGPSVPPLDTDALFRQGKFAEAAAAAPDEARKSLASLGAAFARAFPPPPEPYVVAELNGGSEHEGFATETVGEVRLLHPSGRAIGLPASMVVAKRELTREQMLARAVPAIEEEAASGDARRLFRAAAACFRVDRPDLAAPLVARIVGADAGGILKAITRDVPEAAKNDLLRAYSEAMIAQRMPAPKPEPTPTTKRDEPDRTSPLRPDNTGMKNGSRKSRLAIKSDEAKKLVSQARPLREAGEKLYDRIYDAGLDKARPDDIDEAIRKYKSAMDLYEKAFEIEDNDTIYALLTGCSRKLFQLRFWKEQVGSR